MWNFMSRRVRRGDKFIIWLYKEKIPRNDPNFTTSSFNIYTPSVFCYDKHKKNFDIQFSLKRHETV